MIKNKKFDYLDLIRGLAALAVFIGHLRILCFSDTTTELGLLGKVFFFLTGFGHIAVILFFVLSGFLIIKSIYENSMKGNWNPVNYSKNRLVRLWVVLIPCLFLGYYLDVIGLKYWGDSLLYSNQLSYSMGLGIKDNLSLSTFIGNVFFLQKIVVSTLGSNGSLWSLTNEFWYYVIFPLFYFSIAGKYTIRLRVALFTLGILILIFVGTQISLNFIIWLLGGFAYFLSIKLGDKYRNSKTTLFVSIGIFLITAFLIRSGIFPEVFNYYTMGLAFSFLIPFIVDYPISNNILKRCVNYFSDISYTLYLSHLPFIFLITSIFNFQNQEVTFKNVLVYCGIVCLTLLYATMIWYLFERNTARIKNWLFTKSQVQLTTEVKNPSKLGG